MSAWRQYQTLPYELWVFHHSPLGYLEEEKPQFVDITDKPELAIEPGNDDQPITDSEDEKTRKGLKHTTKRQARRDNLCNLLRQALLAESATFLLSRSPLLTSLSCSPLPTLSCFPIPALSFPLVLALSCPPISDLLSFPMLILSRRLVPALSSSFVLVSSSPSILALSSVFVLGPTPTHLIFSALRTSK